MLPANVDELVKGLREASRVVKADGKPLDLFRVAYHAATSLRSYCVDFSEKGGEGSSYSAGARLYSSDGGEKVVKQIRVGSDVKGIELKLWSLSKEKSDAKIEETAKKFSKSYPV